MSSPRVFVDEVVNGLFLVPHDVQDRMTLVSELFEQLPVVIPVDDASSASNDIAGRMLRQEAFEDGRFGVAESGPAAFRDESVDRAMERLESRVCVDKRSPERRCGDETQRRLADPAC